jgi:CBS domain-containing protein
MSNTDNPQQDVAKTESIANTIADWVNRYRTKIGASDDFGRCDADEVMQIAHDLGASPAELREFVQKGPGAADLLQKMLIALNVDPVSLSAKSPGTMRDLQRLCIMCEEKKRCVHELADGTAGEHFHEFCPNAYTLDALLSEIGAGHPDGKPRRRVMRASDVMVSEVITVGPEATVQEIASILLSNRISAVPVVDAQGNLIGIVSEGDLIHRVEMGTERRHPWWLDLLRDKGAIADEFLKSHATKAADVMTKRVIVASPHLALGDLASLLEKNRIKRVPIVENGKLVGIVSRANLIQALAVLHREAPVEPASNDSALRERVLSEIRSKIRTSASQINVIVRDGVVELWGAVELRDEKDALRVAAELTPGVRAVEDHITINKIPYWV